MNAGAALSPKLSPAGTRLRGPVPLKYQVLKGLVLKGIAASLALLAMTGLA